MQITAAVVKEKGTPFQITELDLEEPHGDDVLVRIVATGMCRTDVNMRNQMYPSPLPIVFGHEGAGVVERVGEHVKKVQPGDHVVLSFSSCGNCTSCQQGRPGYCLHFWNYNFGGTRVDGSTVLKQGESIVHSHFFGQSSFSTSLIAAERSVVKVPSDVPLEILGPLGCGVLAGAGAVFNTLHPDVGTSFAVFGAGTVGLSSVMAAKVAGCSPIIAVDVQPNRLIIASELGATHTINATEQDPLEAIQKITSGGVNYSIEATGLPGVFRQAVDALGQQGVCGQIGDAAFGVEGALDLGMLVLYGRTVRGIVQGDCATDVFIPRLIELYRQGCFPFDRLITFYDFEQINEAARDIENGSTIKPILRMPS